MVPRGLEPRTLRLLAVRSDQLSYETVNSFIQSLFLLFVKRIIFADIAVKLYIITTGTEKSASYENVVRDSLVG